MVLIGKNPIQSDTVSPCTTNSPTGYATTDINHTHRSYQPCGFTLSEQIERRNLIIRQLALSPKKERKPREKTLNQIILSTPKEELQGVLKKMGLLK